jgi:hypothetical protein
MTLLNAPIQPRTCAARDVAEEVPTLARWTGLPAGEDMADALSAEEESSTRFGRTFIPPSVADPKERARILEEALELARRNPIPPDAPRLTREQMHERR